MNVAVIGLGYWGPNIVRNFKMNNHIDRLVCCDTDEGQLEKVKNNFRDIETTTNFNSVLDDENIDAVAIVTPVDTHYELAKRALQKGKHIIVEKPLTSNVKQAEELVQLAKDNDLVAMVDHTFLYTSAVKKINGEVISANFKEIKRKDDPNRIVAETSKEFSQEKLQILLQTYSMKKFQADTAIINNFTGLKMGEINFTEYLSVFPYKNKIVTFV